MNRGIFKLFKILGIFILFQTNLLFALEEKITPKTRTVIDKKGNIDTKKLD